EAWQDLRSIGAAARWLLRQAAAQRWNLPAERLGTHAGWVIAPDGRRLDYGELAAAAAQLQLPDAGVALKSASDYRLIGQPAGDVDARAMLSGRQAFAFDQTWGDGYVAVIARCPYAEGELEHLDDSKARAVAGVEKIIPISVREAAGLIGEVPL
ncbi:isoquinoline 1-oxidoreductase beta subunit, partial [mine drainage metagenome]